MREYLDGSHATQARARRGFEARVARNALAVVERELRLGSGPGRGPRGAPGALGFDDDAALAAAIRAGDARRRLGRRWPPRWPRRRATSCWWPTRPTCRPTARRPPAADDLGLGADRRVGHLGRRGGADALEDGAGQRGCSRS